MLHLIRKTVLMALAVVMLVAVPVTWAQADDYGPRRGYQRYQPYWDDYWGWYDRSYRPYYHRRYYRPYYDDGYYYRGRHAVPGPHSSLEIEPLHLDWY